MNRMLLVVVSLLIGLGFFAVLMARGSNRDLLPFLGKWTGGFEVQQIPQGPDYPKNRQRNRLRGYLQVYASNRKFLLHLEGEQEMVDLAGAWRKTGMRRIQLHFSDVKIDDSGGAQSRNPNLEFIPSAEVRSAYSHDLVLDLSLDGQSLTGLLMDVGPLVGIHIFSR